MFQILLVEDNHSTTLYLQALLAEANYDVAAAQNAEEAFSVLERQHIDLILLDVMLPGMDGYEITKTLRDTGCRLPILLLTARQLPEDKYQGFDCGADDYLTKPADENELLLRIRALLRRSHTISERRLSAGGITLYYDELMVDTGTKKLTLPKKEFYLLYKLLSFPNHIFTRIQLMEEIWGIESDSSDSTINVHINRLRKRFSDCSGFEIVAIRGIGYKAVVK